MEYRIRHNNITRHIIIRRTSRQGHERQSITSRRRIEKYRKKKK